ncbi:hypothetical protein CC1G_15015 [Coprinopsis cinerea okayama7|uniref:Uncharacterized protein n=1 Tax=Coprinopsis cinerea (strain Okayama-7 / 130 / ATCC MYA-4618 / FGSC 9003) TaxID=240176 RepID=D6RP67_COPC7|nr:hypothetical protein CC1G_15015 [Coprinopsis cinerea okayama7\|eukprot:XP_002910684.1 hypothetical protein CC1G_15015 [Coprinopsis cinerea okayama7\
MLSVRFILSSLLLLAPAVKVSLAAPSPSGPAQCITFDANWNLLAFNFDGKDYNAGPGPSFSESTDITQPENRPPFDVISSSPLCFLSKFTNSIYVLNADANDRSSVYIYDATAQSWSKQVTSDPPASYAPETFGAILDHDTNVFYVLSEGDIRSLNMELLKSATDEAIPWNLVQTPQLTPGGEGSSEGQSYEPVLALARNHVHFLGVPGLEPGTDRIFVIHFSYLQPEIQSYGEIQFPNTHGKTASFFKDTGVQTHYAFIPDDGSNTYVIDYNTNTTMRLPGPPLTDPYAMYAASPNALVQLGSSQGTLQWLSFDQDTNQGGSEWTPITSLPQVTGITSTPSTGNRTASGNSTNSGNGTSGAGEEGEEGGAPAPAYTKPLLLVASLFSLALGAFAL